MMFCRVFAFTVKHFVENLKKKMGYTGLVLPAKQENIYMSESAKIPYSNILNSKIPNLHTPKVQSQSAKLNKFTHFLTIISKVSKFYVPNSHLNSWRDTGQSISNKGSIAMNSLGSRVFTCSDYPYFVLYVNHKHLLAAMDSCIKF